MLIDIQNPTISLNISVLVPNAPVPQNSDGMYIIYNIHRREMRDFYYCVHSVNLVHY